MRRIAIYFILTFTFSFGGIFQTHASETNGTIVSGGNNGYAWSNQAGWVNFGCSNCGISITDSGITGYVWNNSYGWINMNPSNGGITIAANGALSGYTWSLGLGWVNFSGASINSSGKFTGQASGTLIGTLTFDCANCSVTTDYRPQNFRVSTQSAATSGGGGGSWGGGGEISFVSGPDGRPISAHISAVNVPMKIFPVQSGILTQYLTDQKRITIDVPSNVFANELTYVIREEKITSTIIPTTTLISNTVFDITARDDANHIIHTLLKPIKITFSIPELLRGRTDLGVYSFDVTKLSWVKIPDAVFNGDLVSFFIDHLTLFAIFGTTESSLTTPSPLSSQTVISTLQMPKIQLPREKTSSTKIASEENPPLFDIEMGPGTLGSKSKAGQIIVAVLITAGITAAVYIVLKRRRNAQK